MAASERGLRIRASPEHRHIYGHDGDFSQSSTEEIHEWMVVNRKLRKHGLAAVRILPSEDLSLHPGRYVCMDLESSQSLRSCVTSLMSEVGRRDVTVTDLTRTNSQLRDEVAHWTEEAHMLSAKVKDIKVMLECSRARVQELEKDSSKVSSHFTEDPERAWKDRSALASKCRQLETQIVEQDRELARLRREMTACVHEDDLGNKKVNHMFSDVRKQKTFSNKHEKNPEERKKTELLSSHRKQNIKLLHVGSMSLEQCQRYLRDVCVELGTEDLDCVVDVLKKIKDDRNNNARFKQYCVKFSQIVESINAQHRDRDRDVTAVLADSNIRYYLQIVENWSHDISAMGELQDAINRLLDKVVPWIHARMDYDHSVPDMVELIEQVTHADKNDKKMAMMEDVSRSSLETIVSHFQTLFDVPRVCGVLPRMNEIYRVTGETRNVLNTLKNILGLKGGASTAALVDAVGRLCYRYNSTTAQQLKKLLETDDLNGVIRRLQEHNQFFPPFRVVVEKLFDILGVSKMDEIVPAVRALKLLSS